MKLADQGQSGCRARGSFPRERDRSRIRLPVCGRSVHVATGCVIIALAPGIRDCAGPATASPSGGSPVRWPPITWDNRPE